VRIRINSDGQATVPVELLDEAELRPGDAVVATVTGPGAISLTRYVPPPIVGWKPAGTNEIEILGSIALFAGDACPPGWIECEGQLLFLSMNPPLFYIVGTQYGGDGRSTFALPDLRGREPSPGLKFIIAMQGIYLPRREAWAQLAHLWPPAAGVADSESAAGADEEGATPIMLGTIILFAGDFTPKGWLDCRGQLLSIATNEPLFSAIKLTYGGDGIDTFGLPDLTGHEPAPGLRYLIAAEGEPVEGEPA
jgi:microcystin-dependent protein/bifunctional DNA-binding transcriptional regulator/antitoxin component of YhaV-PrlF toxin-antitoxin module